MVQRGNRFYGLMFVAALGFQLQNHIVLAKPPLSEEEQTTLQARHQEIIRRTTKGIEESPKKTALYSERGDARFFAGDFPGAVADYEKMVELEPKLATSHWRRGIAYFYAEKYREAANQFEIYHTFDDVDRENGIWRFFSQTKAYGLKKSQAGLLKYKKDDREPFPDVYRLFANKITPEQIVENINKAKLTPTESQKREFYAHLYIGLNHALHDRAKEAKTHLAKAIENKWAIDAGFGPNYMWHVGRVNYDLLMKESSRPETKSPENP